MIYDVLLRLRHSLLCNNLNPKMVTLTIHDPDRAFREVLRDELGSAAFTAVTSEPPRIFGFTLDFVDDQ